MNDYFMYATVITLAFFVHQCYTLKKKNFTLQVELDLIKARGRLGSINVNLEENRIAYKAARDKFHNDLHGIPDYMLEHVSSTSTDGPSTDTRGPTDGATGGPTGPSSEQ